MQRICNDYCRWKSVESTLSRPFGICFDQCKQRIYIADYWNHRIVEWKSNANDGQIVAGGNGQGNRLDQLNRPTDVIILCTSPMQIIIV